MDKRTKKYLVKKVAKLWVRMKNLESKVRGDGVVYKLTADELSKFEGFDYYTLKDRIKDISYMIKSLKIEYKKKIRAA